MPVLTASPIRWRGSRRSLLRAIPGTYTRSRAKRSGGNRSRIRPAKSGRRSRSPRDAIDSEIVNQPGVNNFLPTGSTQALRVMRRSVSNTLSLLTFRPWGSTTIEPIAQIIISSERTYAGRLPNEDAQSMVFGHFEPVQRGQVLGHDRVEGGGRANVGVSATTSSTAAARQRAVRSILSAIRPELFRRPGHDQHRHRFRLAKRSPTTSPA